MEVKLKLQRERGAVETKRGLAFTKLWCEAFDGVFSDAIHIEAGDQSCRLRRKDGGYWRDVLDIYYYEGWRSRSNKEHSIDELKVSHSSGGGTTDEEFERMIIIGKVGYIMKNRKEELTKKILEIKATFAGEIKELTSAIYDLEKAEQQRREDAEAIKLARRLSKLEKEGLYYAPEVTCDERRWDKGYEYNTSHTPSLQVRFNDDINRLAYLKITKVSASGKTCNIEYKNWNYDYVKTEEEESYYLPIGPSPLRTYDRVQMSNITAFIKGSGENTFDGEFDKNGNPIVIIPPMKLVEEETV